MRSSKLNGAYRVTTTEPIHKLPDRVVHVKQLQSCSQVPTGKIQMRPCTSFMIELSKWNVAYQAEQETSAEIVQYRMTSWKYIRWWRGYPLKFSCWVWPVEKQRVRSIQKESLISLVTQLSTSLRRREDPHQERNAWNLFRPMTEVA